MLDALLVICLVGAVVWVLVWLLTPSTPQRRAAVVSGRWRVAHYDVKGETRVVLQRVSAEGAKVLDEHVIATVRADDPEYDEKFLTAMSTARQRQALFEAEDGA